MMAVLWRFLLIGKRDKQCLPNKGHRMSDLSYDDAHMRRILREVRTIAMVGACPNCPAFEFCHEVSTGERLQGHPNPGQAVAILGEPCYASVAEIPGTVDMIDIFRNSEAAGAVVDDILPIASEKKIRVIWMQLGIRNDNAAARAKAAGLTVIMDRCPKIEYGRLFEN